MLNPASGGQLDCTVKNKSRDSHLLKVLWVAKHWERRYAVRNHPQWLIVGSSFSLADHLPPSFSEDRDTVLWFISSMCCLTGNGWAGIWMADLGISLLPGSWGALHWQRKSGLLQAQLLSIHIFSTKDCRRPCIQLQLGSFSSLKQGTHLFLQGMYMPLVEIWLHPPLWRNNFLKMLVFLMFSF